MRDCRQGSPNQPIGRWTLDAGAEVYEVGANYPDATRCGVQRVRDEHERGAKRNCHGCRQVRPHRDGFCTMGDGPWLG